MAFHNTSKHNSYLRKKILKISIIENQNIQTHRKYNKFSH